MIIFITNLHSRKEMLVANSIAQEINGEIQIFEHINIYDTYLSGQNNYIVISEDDTNNVFISKFLNDISNNSIINKNNKIVFLYKNKELFKHNNIISIPYNTFYHYNEYVSLPIRDSGYILCELNCISQKKNAILESIIYPNNNKIPVRLVNCPRFDHPQNLGVVNDYDMLKLIASCSVFIGITDNYVYDAIYMKKPTLTTVDNKIIKQISSLSMEDIKNCSFDESYTSELNKYKISNIIKYKLK